MNHGIVTVRDDQWSQCKYHHLRMPDGTLSAIPARMVTNAGDVVAVLTDHEWKLIQSYRENVKHKM